jgi:serine/threonine protein kinase
MTPVRTRDETKRGTSVPAPSAPELRIGTTIGAYRIEAIAGRGGMGVVYRAEHLHLGRPAALKLLLPELADDEGFRERFLRESRVAAAITHPNVIPVYDAGEADGLLYIAMKYVDGTDLGAVLRQEGALEPERALFLLGQVAEALDAAHAMGIVHRDVKPGTRVAAT